MMMFLTILFTSLLATAVCALMFAKASPRREAQPEVRPFEKLAAESPKFFAGDLVTPVEATVLPREILLSQIERHVRLEQAAAETFLDVATTEALHTRTPSPFVN